MPPFLGITSAIGLLTTDLKYDTVRTSFQVSDALDLERLNRDLATMQGQLVEQFAIDGLAADQLGFARAGDLRYAGQGYELRACARLGEALTWPCSTPRSKVPSPTRDRVRPRPSGAA